MNRYLLSCALGALLLATTCSRADESNPQGRIFPTQSFGEPRVKIRVTPPSSMKELAKGNWLFSVRVEPTTGDELFGKLKEATGKQFVVADDVKRQTMLRFSSGPLKVDALVAYICESNSLTWGKTGEDTYLIVRAPQQTLVIASPGTAPTFPRVAPEWGQQSPHNPLLWFLRKASNK